MLRCVLFDLDEVLADYDRSIRVGHLAQAIDSTPEAVYAAIYQSGIEDAADRGELTSQAYLDALGAYLRRPVSVEAWTAARREATRLRPELLALAKSLAERVTVAVLTNNSLLLVQQLPRIVPALFPLFEGRSFASAEFGASKPDPRVYLSCLARLSMPADATLFVDDNLSNVEGALQAGLYAHHYQDLAGLRSTLARFDLP
ncbi:HAD family hydrolase [Dyella amyloliquefaciens]|uniref:HAD family hydrolase n=1 Tax=Dyella amyloliquefaciens TaxID=1770545 RepID=UPI00102E70AD|nr:HAD family phosphatase [Dyella amyloliquefaciens]